jgi:hypothetical protein
MGGGYDRVAKKGYPIKDIHRLALHKERLVLCHPWQVVYQSDCDEHG